LHDPSRARRRKAPHATEGDPPMLIVGERINATRSRIRLALEDRDERYIYKEAQKQLKAGADYLDVNAGADPAKEAESLVWLTQVLLRHTTAPLCLDSASPEALAAALEAYSGAQVMINSVSAEKEKLENVLPLVAKYDAEVVALAMADTGLPTTVDDRIEIVGKLVEAIQKEGIPLERVYFDPCIQPASTSQEQPSIALESVRRVKAEFPGIKAVCGLSNVSFGLPFRALLNRSFMVMMLHAGADAAIIDPTEPGMVPAIVASEALLGVDEWCMKYLEAARGGTLDGD